MHFVRVYSVLNFIEVSVCYHVKFWAPFQACSLSVVAVAPFFQWGRVSSRSCTILRNRKSYL